MKTGIIAARQPQANAAITTLAVIILALLGAGCTHVTRKRDKTAAQLEEHSRAFTAGVVDVLHLQPTEQRDAFTEVALRLAQEDQRIEGLPLEPIAVSALVGVFETNLTTRAVAEKRAEAEEDVAQRISEARAWLGTQRRAEDRLRAFGEEFERKRNEQRVSWFKKGSIITLLAGGLAALVFFVPASVPLLGRILAFCVGRFPALAGTAGVVSVKAFDAVVKAIEHLRSAAPSTSAVSSASLPRSSQLGNQMAGGLEWGELHELQMHLSREMDAAHKALVRERKAALKLDR